MCTDIPTTARQLRSTLHASGILEISLAQIPMSPLADEDVLVRIEAAPINPSDLNLLFESADLDACVLTGTPSDPVLTARVPPHLLQFAAARIGRACSVGNEGAGTVVRAGEARAARALLGKKVACFGGGMYADYRCVPVAQTLLLPDAASVADGASSFVNPMTAQMMIHTMRTEGHRAIVHTAAASNLGRMLNRLCISDNVPLINVVRKEDQVLALQAAGAQIVFNASRTNFRDELVEALIQTKATVAFDAIGGGETVDCLLNAMETAASRGQPDFSAYGSAYGSFVHKQVYIYGGLDSSPTILRRTYGMSWGICAFLLPAVMMKAGFEVIEAMRQRIAAELTTTFATHYGAEISLTDMLHPEAAHAYSRIATGRKYLVRPHG